MKLNLGCGAQTPENWINVDYAFGAKMAKMPFFRSINKKINIFDLNWDDSIYIHNLTKKFPWENNSIDIVYSSHTLEHLSREQGVLFLKECHRILKTNGIIRILVPDLRHIINKYLDGSIGADHFVEQLGVLTRDKDSISKKLLGHLLQFPHKCMYDNLALLKIMKTIGFDVESVQPFESKIPDILKIELKHRTSNAVIVEGRKL